MPANNHADDQAGPAEPTPRRGAVSVLTPSEYEKLRAYKNDKTGVLEYKEREESDEADEPSSSKQ